MNYEMRLIPKQDAEGKTYWTAFFPAVTACIGGGETPEEAIQEAKENLEIYLEYLKEEKKEIPPVYVETNYNGRVALRLPKNTHRRLAEFAEAEGVSANTILISAVENYLGLKQYDYALEDKINKLQEIAAQSLSLQVLNYNFNQKIADSWNIKYYKGAL